VRVCPRCQHENADDTDFCAQCGEYLRWDPTVATPAVPPRPPSGGQPPAAPPSPPAGGSPPPAPPPAPASVAGTAAVNLRLAGVDAAAVGDVTATVEPGKTVAVLALVRNQSGIVDNYDVRVEGVPEGWWTVQPQTVYLVPYGAPGGTYEQEVEVRLHPPRTAEAVARTWPLTVVARARSAGADAGSAPATLEVAPYHQLEAEIRPERAGGRRAARFGFAVTNTSNAPVDVHFASSAQDEECVFTFEQDQVNAAPGKRAGTGFTVRPRKQIWIGRPVDHPFRITATAAGSDTETFRQGVFRQRPWLPWWVPLAVALAIAGGILAYTAFHHAGKKTVPDLTGQTLAQAQSALQKAGLALAPGTQPTKPVGPAKVGKVVFQSPSAQAKVKQDTPVTVTIGIGSQQTLVPDVCGKSYGDAQQALTASHLTVGQVQPATATPASTTLPTGCSVPAADPTKQVPFGTPVNLFMQSTGGSGSGGGGGGGGGGGTAVPSLVGMPESAAETTLTGAGLTGTAIAVLSPSVAAGTVAAQAPAKGATISPGGTVFLYVSTAPRIAYDGGAAANMSAISVASGTSSSTLVTAAPTGFANVEPSWSPDSALIAYVSKQLAAPGVGTIHIVNLKKSTDTPVNTGGVDAHRPVFAPFGGHHRLVFTENPGTGGWMPCFLDVDNPLPQSQWCAKPEAGGDALDRPTWSPDGKEVLFEAFNPSTGAPDGLRAYSTQTPFAESGSKWTELAAPLLPGWSVYYVAWSPDGQTIALTTKGPPSSPATADALYLTTPQALAAGTATPVGTGGTASVPAAELSWRSDGTLVYSGLGCESSTPTQPLALINPQSPSLAQPPLTVVGCDPAVEPLPPPPSG